MNLPSYIRFAPLAFYVIAGLSLLFGILLPIIEFERFGFSDDLPVQDALAKSVVFQLVIRQVVEAAYIAANGLIVDVLIRIWAKLGRGAEAAE